MAAEGESDPVKELLDNELGDLRTFTGISMNRKFFEAKREQFHGDNPYGRQAAVLGLLSWLYSFCSRHFASKYLDIDEKPDAVELALEILQNHIEKTIDLDLLARKVGINRFSLVRKFSRQMGISPIKYLVLERNGIFSKKHPCNRPDFAPTSSANPYASASSQILSSGYQC